MRVQKMGGFVGSEFLLSESRIYRITQISRILGVFLFVVAQFIAPFSESRIITNFTGDVDYLLSESRIIAEDTDFAD